MRDCIAIQSKKLNLGDEREFIGSDRDPGA
jgi:hypothetical protein